MRILPHHTLDETLTGVALSPKDATEKPNKFSSNSMTGRSTREDPQLIYRSHANGAEQDDLVEFELEQIHTQFRLDEELKATGETGWNMFIRTPGMRKRLYLILIVSFFSQWAGNGIICKHLRAA